LANLYFLCASEFVNINNLLQEDDSKLMFQHCLIKYKCELLDVVDGDIFTTDIPKITGILENVIDSEVNQFLVNVWSYLKAIDRMVSDDTIYLNRMRPIWCKTSKKFDSKEFRLLFKTKNLIFGAIKDRAVKNKLSRGKIKTGFDIGQRIADHLEKMIFYSEDLTRKIAIKSIDNTVDELLLAQGKNLAFAVAPIYYDFEYSFRRYKSFQGVPYVFEEIKNRKKIEEIITYILKKCIEEDVHIVVFPELAIDVKLRDHIANWLKRNNEEKKIIMVVAGSYHILKNRRKKQYENSCIVYRFDGQELWEQKKMNRFQLDQDDMNKIRNSNQKAFKDFKQLFKPPDKNGWEKIEISDTLVINESSIGRMAVTICLDYFVREKDKLLIESQINLVFLPSMSPSLKRMDISNIDLSTYAQTSVFCCNSCWIVTGAEKCNFNRDHSSFIYIPQKNGLMHMDCEAKCDCLKCNLKIFRISQISGNF
ncbi:MAG: hypothetical protein JSV88_27000, partial [Candidatus Aminicenantes bacterium]